MVEHPARPMLQETVVANHRLMGAEARIKEGSGAWNWGGFTRKHADFVLKMSGFMAFHGFVCFRLTSMNGDRFHIPKLFQHNMLVFVGHVDHPMLRVWNCWYVLIILKDFWGGLKLDWNMLRPSDKARCVCPVFCKHTHDNIKARCPISDVSVQKCGTPNVLYYIDYLYNTYLCNYIVIWQVFRLIWYLVCFEPYPSDTDTKRGAGYDVGSFHRCCRKM